MPQTVVVPDSICRYSDDVLLACDTVGGLLHAIDEMSKRFLCGLPESFNGKRYIGNTFTYKGSKNESDGSVDYALKWEQSELVGKYLDEYSNMLKEREMKPIKERPTPAPVSEGGHVAKTREQDEEDSKRAAAEEEKPGKLKDVALHYVNGMAFVAGGSRPDINYAIHQLQCSTAHWFESTDRLLSWLFGYLQKTRNRCLHGYINSKDVHDGTLYVLIQSDASHAPSRRGRKSIGCYNVYLKGPRTSILLESATKTLQVVTLSSMESEAATAQLAGKAGTRYKMLVDLILGVELPDGESLYRLGVEMGLEMDALSAIHAIRKSVSNKVLFTRRTTGTSLYWLHEVFCEDEKTWLRHKKGEYLSADAGTKSLPESVFSRHMAEMGILEKTIYINADTHSKINRCDVHDGDGAAAAGGDARAAG